jgi:hypothetical protein
VALPGVGRAGRAASGATRTRIESRRWDSPPGLWVQIENILANKLTALADRNEPKDVADIWGFGCAHSTNSTLGERRVVPRTDGELSGLRLVAPRLAGVRWPTD